MEGNVRALLIEAAPESWIRRSLAWRPVPRGHERLLTAEKTGLFPHPAASAFPAPARLGKLCKHVAAALYGWEPGWIAIPRFSFAAENRVGRPGFPGC